MSRKRFYFSEENVNYLKEHYRNTLNADLAKTIGCKISSVENKATRLGLKKDKSFIAEIARQRSSDPSHPMRKYHFKKGHNSWNTGKRQSEYLTPEAIERTKATRFKKGQKPHNHKPVGHERITADGYREIKTAEPNVFKLVHRVVWEKQEDDVFQEVKRFIKVDTDIRHKYPRMFIRKRMTILVGKPN